MDLPDDPTWLSARQLAAAMPARRVAAALPAGLPGVQPLVRRQLADLFGIPDLTGGAPTTTGLVGLFGAGSPSRRVLAEPAAIAGGVRGLFVQAAHPLAMAGVSDHSRYRQDPLARLAGTSAWVTVTAFGSVEAVDVQARRVRAMHRRVVGEHAGRRYAASDPELLVWVSIALTSSFLAAHALLAPRPLTPLEADRFVAEQSLAAALLDPAFPLEETAPGDLADLDVGALPVARAGLPTDVAGLARTLQAQAGRLEVMGPARDALAFLYEVAVPAALRPAYRRILDGVVASLPPGLRTDFGFAGIPEERALRRLAAIMTAMRVTTGRSPSYHRSRTLLRAH